MTLGEVGTKGMNSIVLESILTETMADRIHQQALQTPVSKSSKVTSPLTDDNNPTMGLDGSLPLRKEGVQSQFQSQPNSMPSATAASVAIQGGSNGHGQGFSDPSNQPGQSQTPGGPPSGNNSSNAGSPPPPPGPSGGLVPNLYGNPGGGGGSGRGPGGGGGGGYSSTPLPHSPQGPYPDPRIGGKDLTGVWSGAGTFQGDLPRTTKCYRKYYNPRDRTFGASQAESGCREGLAKKQTECLFRMKSESSDGKPSFQEACKTCETFMEETGMEPVFSIWTRDHKIINMFKELGKLMAQTVEE